MLVSPQLAGRVDEWNPLGGRVCVLRLKLIDCSQRFMQVFGLNSRALYPNIVKETGDAMLSIKVYETTMYLADVRAHVGN